MTSDSLHNWLCQQIQDVLNRKGGERGFILWCDPDREWKDLLAMAAQGGGFQLWADESHELLLRERFQKAPPAKRVIWVPVARNDVTYFKVFELRAAEVITWTLPEALVQYGVELSPDQLVELKPLLSAHAKEWFNRPFSAWKELTPGNAKGTLMDDDAVLELLASSGKTFESLLAGNRFSLFTRRLTEDFGLPIPSEKDADAWRVQAVAALLCTDAAAKCPGNGPGDPNRIVPSGAQRERSLKLLSRWQKQVDLMQSFEELARQADGLTSLQYWARGLPALPPPLASPGAEMACFDKTVKQVSAIEDFESLAKALETNIGHYRSHADGFWGRRAEDKVGWGHLAKLASAASLLLQHARTETLWRSPSEAVDWFTHQGWEVDQQGEVLFRDNAAMPGGLVGVLARIRKAYLRHLDATNSAFSELLSHAGLESLALPFAGQTIKGLVASATTKEPVAVVVLDALRFDLGQRLAELLNQGEPTRRAEVSAARAPIPSVTALGMPLCLPGSADQLHMDVQGRKWRVTADGFDGDLAEADQRREWLKSTFKLKEKATRLTVAEIANASSLEWLSAKALGRLVFVFGDELDDHDGVLKPFGLDQTLERYASVVRKLRSAGYSQVAVVTDHGFYHWEPAADEKEMSKPEGEILIENRRAVAGHGLAHKAALKFKVTQSELEACLPRSVNCFKTCGRIGFFHGGATLQELITPVVIARWPKKARKSGVVLKPLGQITSLAPKVEVAPGACEQDLLGAVDENLLSRNVLVKVVAPASGKVLFKAKHALVIVPGGDTQMAELERVKGSAALRGAELQLQALDADDEEILDRQPVTLQVELDEWF